MIVLDLFESAAFGSNYAEQLAQQVYDSNPELDATGQAEEVLDAGWDIAREQMGSKRAQSIFVYDEDFAGDFVSAYAYLQQGGAAHFKEGWKGELAGGTVGGIAGNLAGNAIVPGIGGVVGGALGSTAGGMVGRTLTKEESKLKEIDNTKAGMAIGAALGGLSGGLAGAGLGAQAGATIGSLTDEEKQKRQLNEFAPLLVAGARALLPLLARIGPALGRGATTAGRAAAPALKKGAEIAAKGAGQVAKGGAEIAAKNAGNIGLGLGTYAAITDLADKVAGGVGEVYSDVKSAAAAITDKIGDTLDNATILTLAQAAVKYAVPIGIVIGLLYGGKKLIDKVLAEDSKFPEPRRATAIELRTGGTASKSETLGKDGMVYHWQDPRAKQGVAEAEDPEKELERLKLRQNAEHGRAPLKRQAATQARIRELEKQIKGNVAEGSEQQYSVLIDAVDHGVLGAIKVTASSPQEAKQKAIEIASRSYLQRGYKLAVRSAVVRPVKAQGVAETQDNDGRFVYPPGQLENIVKKLQKIGGFVRKHPNINDQMEVAYWVAERMRKGMGFDRAVQFGVMDYNSLQGVAEGFADDFAAFAKERGGVLRHGPQPTKPATKPAATQAAPVDRAALTAELKQLQSEFDPHYQYSEDYTFVKQQERIADRIAGIKQKLKQSSVKEAARLPYPEGSENLGRANMELLIRAYNEPTSPRLVLNFGKNTIDLDRDDINAIADYYDDELPNNDARWNFIRAVMSNYENFTTVLGKLGRRKMPMAQPGLFQEENKKKDDDLGPQVRDVGLQRAITRAKADFPTAGTGIEALAKDFMRSQDQDKKDFEQIRQADRQQNKMLSQISKVDQDQQAEIKDLENKNSTLAQRLQQLQAVNNRLEKTLADMSGRKPKAAEKPTAPKADGTPTAVPGPIAAKTPEPQEPEVKQLANEPSDEPDTGAMANIATQLAPNAAPQIANEPSDNILPPMFRRAENPEFARARTTATDVASRPTVDPSVIVPRKAPRDQELELAAENKDKDFDKFGPEWDAMVKRVGKVAKAGPLKTVWDPVKRVYKNVPVNTPKTQN